MHNFDRDLLIGTWFRSEIQNQQQITEQASFNPDGTFEFCFSSIEHNTELQHQVIEFGDWGLVGDIHFTITKSELIDDNHYAADLNNKDNYHAYRVLKLNAVEFCYQHVETGEQYRLKRITDEIGHG